MRLFIFLLNKLEFLNIGNYKGDNADFSNYKGDNKNSCFGLKFVPFYLYNYIESNSDILEWRRNYNIQKNK